MLRKAFASIIALGTIAGSVTMSASAEGDLYRLRDGRSMRASSSDPDWRNGNRDARPIGPGETLTLADIEGPGIIRHIWFTIAADDPRWGRSLTLRMYWDGQEEPAVESPIGDFFAVGNGDKRMMESQPVAVSSEGRALNCYWPMPFAKHARLTLTNDSKEHAARAIYFYIDYEKVPALPPDSAYFHAQYRQEYPAKLGENYLILDTEGRGHYVGTVLSVIARTAGWFGEGDDFFFIDGEEEPSIRGTGTEDYFCDAWGFREFDRPYYGVVIFDGYEVGDHISVYRWHIKDPVHFTKSLKVTIEHKGEMSDETGKRISGFHERADLFSSVAFWYQTGAAKRFATLPPADERVVHAARIELETCQKRAHATPEGLQVDGARNWLASGTRHLQLDAEGPGATLSVPFTLEEPAQGPARLTLSCGPEYGIWEVTLDGKPVKGVSPVDLSADKEAMRQIKLGVVDLAAGEHVLAFECQGKSSSASGHRLGADVLVIEKLTEYRVPATAPAQ